MATVTALPAVDERLWRLSVSRYHAMIAAGILTGDDHVELLEGVLVEKMPKYAPHFLSVRETFGCLSQVIPPGWFVTTQDPVTLEESEPEPDVMVVRGSSRQYEDRHPGSGDVGLIVEVADSSLTRDRVLKKRIYARAAIPVYWILDLNSRNLEVHTDPQGADYRTKLVLAEDQDVILTLDGQALPPIAVKELLPLGRQSKTIQS